MQQRNDTESIPIAKRSASKNKRVRTHNNKRIKIDFKDREYSRYYMAVSNRYRYTKTVSFLLLIAFLAVNLLFFRSSITYSNMMYLLRDLDTGGFIKTGEFASLSYSEQDSAAFTLYKGRLAAAGSTGFRLYNSTGSRELEKETYMQNPRVDAGEKYAIAYDAGGSTYNIFTTIATVLSAESDGVLEDACVSNSGAYALLTRSSEAKYLITVYNSSFRAETKYYKDKYVVDMAFSKTGEQLAVVSADVDTAGIKTEVMLCRPGTDKTETVTAENAMPLTAKYMTNGNLLVLCDSRLLVIKDSQTVKEYTFQSGNPSVFNATEEAMAVVCNENAVGTNNTLFLFDSDGNLIYNSKTNEKISKISIDGTGLIYLLCEDGIRRIDTAGGESYYKADQRIIEMIPLYGQLLVCTSTGAGLVLFDVIN